MSAANCEHLPAAGQAITHSSPSTEKRSTESRLLQRATELPTCGRPPCHACSFNFAGTPNVPSTTSTKFRSSRRMNRPV